MHMTQNSAEWLTLEQAAERFGKSVSAIRLYISRGFIKKYRRPVDPRVYVRADELEDLLTSPPTLADDSEK